MRRCAFVMASQACCFLMRRIQVVQPVPPPPSTPPIPPPLGPPSRELQRVIEALETEGTMLEAVLDELDPETRRKLVIAGVAAQWFGRDNVRKEIRDADYDKDKVISPKDFDNWFKNALKRQAHNAAKKSGKKEGAETLSPNIDQTPIGRTKVPFRSLCFIAGEAGLPFVGFGFLDNFIMIVSGDMIDQSIGVAFNCSVMAAAALGNVLSGVLGMQLHGAVEHVMLKLHLPAPILTAEQRESSRVFLAGHIGGTLGIAVGLTLGMLPLFFISSDSEKADRTLFLRADKNKDGYIDAEELQEVLNNKLNVGLTNLTALDVVREYGRKKEGKIDLDEFIVLCKSLRAGDSDILGIGVPVDYVA